MNIINTRFIQGLAVAFVACMSLQACSSGQTDSQGRITLNSLDGQYGSDTMTVSATLPMMPQRQKQSLYHIRDHSTVLNRKPVYLDSVLAPEYRVIQLETTVNSLVGEIDDILVDDSLMFLVDGLGQRVMVFDMNGRFRNNVGMRGHGAGEYAYMSQAALDCRHKRVCIVDSYSERLLFYDYRGKFLGQEPRYFQFGDLAFLDDRRVLLTLPYQHTGYKALDAFRLTVTDERGMPVCGVLGNPGFPDLHTFAYSLQTPLHSTPDGVYYLDVLSPDTIWKVSGKGCVPFVAADFGEPFTTLRAYREMTYEKYNERSKQVRHLYDDFAFSREFGYLRDADGCTIINLQNGKYLTGHMTRNRRLANLLEFAFESYHKRTFLFDWERNQFAKVCMADETRELLDMMRENKDGEQMYQSWPQSDRAILERLSPEDNPLIVVGTFRKF